MTDHISPQEPGKVAIRAGAGSGKTYRITQRYVNLVIYGGLSPLNIVAVTFTEAATLELRSRIRKELTAALGQDDDRLAELEAARISTFHSLAAAICRQHPTEAGVPSDFSILDEVQGALWLADRVDDALDTLPEKLFRRIPFTRLRTVIRVLIQDPITAEKALGKRYRDWRSAIDDLRQSMRVEMLESDWWGTNREYLSSIRGANGDKLEPIRVALVEGMHAFERGEDAAMALQFIADAKINVGSDANWNHQVKEVQAAIRSVREPVKAALKLGLVTMRPGTEDKLMLRRLRDVKRAYDSVTRSLAAAKKRERVLDYADLEVHAIRALQHVEVQHHYHSRWKAFVIDEYQDTNSVQDEIIKRLRNDDTMLAIVGDANQSIYGFRRADPRLIEEAAEEIISAGGMIETLGTSYRTHRGLIADYNTMFQTLFAGSVHGFTPQESVRDAPPGNIGSFQCYQVAASDRKPGRLDQLRVEAINVVRRLKSMMKTGTLVHDKQNRCHRVMEWGDVAIINLTWDSLDTYAEAFASLDVPYVHMGGGNLMETREARDGYALLRFLADPNDDLALAAVLKSPLFSVSDLDLYTLLHKGPTSLWIAMSDAVGELAQHSALLTILRHELYSESPSRLLHRADCDTGLTAILANLPSGERRVADWRGFCALVSDIEKTSYDAFGVARVLRRLDMSLKDRAGGVVVPRPPIDAANRVSLLSIHASKGLEWPIVVMADLAKAARRDDSTILFDPELGVAIKSDDAEMSDQPMLFRLLRYRRSQRDQQEAKRLIYVAATRARDYLLLAATQPHGGRTALSLLEPSLAAAGKEIEFWEFTDADAQPPLPVKTSAMPAAPTLCLDPVAASLTHLPATSLREYERCPKEFEYRHIFGNPGIESAATSTEEDHNGAAALGYGVVDIPSDADYLRRMGTLVHKAIQYEFTDLEVLQRFDRSMDSKAVTNALMMARRFKTDGFFERFRNAEAQHEVQVSWTFDGFTITGRIDLLGPDFVLDFKTGSRREDDEHLVQLWLYAKAKTREEMVIAYFDGMRPSMYLRSKMPEMEVRVQAILSGIRSREFKAKPEMTKCAACRYNTICDNSLFKRE